MSGAHKTHRLDLHVLGNPRETIEQLLAPSEVRLNGPNPWDPRIHDDIVYRRFLSEGRLGLGESYVDGAWDCDALDEFFNKLLLAGIGEKISPLAVALPYLRSRLTNAQSKSRAKRVAQVHYDLGNDLYEAMLDKRFVYTCGYWKNAADLDTAQEQKLELVCRKLQLEPGMKVLDIGCGYGSFAQYAAERHGVEVTGITISQQQLELGRQRCAGLPVSLHLQDYRDLVGVYDRVVSLGMFEHVGFKNYRQYMEIARRCLRDDGLFVMQSIGTLHEAHYADPWMDKYIFPGGAIPTLPLIGRAAEGLFVMEDWHNFGADYDRTLMAWHHNFEAHWPELAEKYGDRFHRIWQYYLLFCAGTFRSRYNQLWQIVFSPKGVPGGYRRPEM